MSDVNPAARRRRFREVHETSGLPGGPSAAKLRGMGVQRISVGSALAWAACAGLADAARELLAGESHDYYARALGNSELFQQAR